MSNATINTTKLEQDQNKLSAEEIRKIAQQSQSDEADSTPDEQPLVSQEQILTSDRKKQSSLKWRYFTVAIIASCAAFAFFLTASVFDSIFGGNSTKVAKSSPPSNNSSEPRIVREDKLKAKLAISKQDGVPQPKPEQKLVVEQPKQAIEPSIPDDTVQTEPVVEPEEEVEVDPLEEWARLASLGSAVGNRETAIALVSNDTNTLASTPTTVSTPTPAPINVSTSAPALTNSHPQAPPLQSGERVTPVANNVEEDTPYLARDIQEPTDDNQITEKETVKIASVLIGKDLIEANPSENQSGDFSLDSPAVSKLLSDQESNNTYLEKKRQQFEEEDRLKELSAMEASNSLELVSVNSVSSLDRSLRPADTRVQAREELLPVDTSVDTEKQTKDDFTSLKPELASTILETPTQDKKTNTKQVPLGTIIPGEISSSIVWSQGSDPEQSRGIINLTEPLLASDGSIALKANSTLIVEVKSINESGLTYLNVIAVSYEDSQGKLKQELLPPGAILIKGEENSALIAEQTSDPGGTVLGQDVLLGLLGAGEKGFQELNQPDENTTISGDNDFVIRTNNDSNSSLINGAAEGIFSTTKERLDERSDQIVEEELARVPIYQLEAGAEVTIFVNSFLEINQ